MTRLMTRVAQAAARVMGKDSDDAQQPTRTPYQQRCHEQLQTLEGARQLLHYLNAAGRPNNGKVPYQAVLKRDSAWKRQLDAVQARLIGLEVAASVDTAAAARDAARREIEASSQSAEKALAKAQTAWHAKRRELEQLQERLAPLRQAAEEHDRAALAEAQREHAQLKQQLAAADVEGRDEDAASLAQQLQAVQGRLAELQRHEGRLPSPAALRVQAMAEVEARLQSELQPLRQAVERAEEHVQGCLAAGVEVDYHEHAAALLLQEARMRYLLYYESGGVAAKAALPRGWPADGVEVLVTRSEFVPDGVYVARQLEKNTSFRAGGRYIGDRLVPMYVPPALDAFERDPTLPWPEEAEQLAAMQAEDAERDAAAAKAHQAVYGDFVTR